MFMRAGSVGPVEYKEDNPVSRTERERIEQAIGVIESQRAALGEAITDIALAALRERLDAVCKARVVPQRKQVTILFADISGFTAMSEKLDAEEVSDLINALWSRIDGAITAHNGLIDKHIGDAVMALFGAPVAREEAPEQAIRAALAMQEEIRAWNQEMGAGEHLISDIHFSIRIGINTGRVLLGSVGTTSEYTAMGDAVNLASRLEGAAPVGGILISHDTYRHVRGIFQVEPLAPIHVKGKQAPVQVYVVHGVKPRAFRVPTRGVEGIETRMIGRDVELARLQKALRSVIETGEMRVVTIVGDAGIGKSRLLHEFKNWVEVLPDEIFQFKARANEQTANSPYFLLRDLFAFRFDIRNSDSVEAARNKLVRGMAQFVGANEKDVSSSERVGVDAEIAAHFIGHLIGLDFSHSPHLQGILNDARQIRDRAFYYATQILSGDLGAPAALLLEDLHWADEGSLDFIRHLAQTCSDAPILIVAVTRPELFEGRALWDGGHAHHIRLELTPLSEQSSHGLVQEILRRVDQVPPDLERLIVKRAAGRPFYTEELVKMLIEDGVIVKGESRWHVVEDRLVDLKVPPTLTGVLQARLDGLASSERETLQRASIVGRVFWDGAVQQLVGREAWDMGEALAALQERELVFGRHSSAFVGEEEYIFKHSILHDVIYESVLKRERPAYHAQVADWLTDKGKERVMEYAGLIGEHYERGGKRLQAAEWYSQAGRRAQDTYAPETAITYYRKALNLLPQPQIEAPSDLHNSYVEQRIELYEGLGTVLRWQARFEEAVEAYDMMLEMAESAGGLAAQARAWEGLSWVQEAQGNYRAMLESAERAESISQATGASAHEIVERTLNKAWAFSDLGETETALPLGEQALALSTELENQRMMADSLNLLGWVHQTMGHYTDAEQCIEQALALYRELDDRNWVGGMLNHLGLIAKSREDYERAAALFREALSIAREVGHRNAEIAVLNNLAGARIGLEEHHAAENDLQKVLEMTELEGWGSLWETYCFLAQVYLGQQDMESALKAARQALALGREVKFQEGIGKAWRVLGSVLADPKSKPSLTIDDQVLDANACFAKSLDIFTELEMEGERARTLKAWAQYEKESGVRERGDEMSQQAREILARLGVL